MERAGAGAAGTGSTGRGTPPLPRVRRGRAHAQHPPGLALSPAGQAAPRGPSRPRGTCLRAPGRRLGARLCRYLRARVAGLAKPVSVALRGRDRVIAQLRGSEGRAEGRASSCGIPARHSQRRFCRRRNRGGARCSCRMLISVYSRGSSSDLAVSKHFHYLLQSACA